MLKSVAKLFGLSPTGASGDALVFHASKTCPECGTQLAQSATAPPERAAAWACPNLDCPAQERARIEHWCSPEVMNIAGADAALVAQFVSRGLVRDVAELYALRYGELASLEGRNETFAQQFLDALAASRNREGWRLLYGLGITDVTAEVAQELTRQIPAVDDILPAGPERLRAAGASEMVARSITRWYSDSINRRLIRRLKKAGLNFNSQLNRA